MFTGIVQTQAKVNAARDQGDFRQLEIAVPPRYLQDLEIGASIAINGCCLTVRSFTAEAQEESGLGLVRFDVIDETLRLTNLGSLDTGSHVNFERSLTMGRELGGHIVSGHIHCTGTVLERIDTTSNCRMLIGVPLTWLEYILPKGFVSVDGASLTVGEVTEQGFWLHLIPETLEVTVLGAARVGTQVNIEADQQTLTIVETVKRVLARQN
ncbi:MAG: riboflavin synthase subunit alpha [Idiomarina sp.]|nr:riboflavin synthase subunit alpha [Idiomarina sp.]